MLTSALVIILHLMYFSTSLPVRPRSAKLPTIKDHTYEDVPQLTFAVSSGAVEEVEALLDAGVDVNKRDWLGQTALHMAAKFQQYECARALLIHGANLSIPNTEYEETALHLAAKTGTVDIMQLLIDYGADVNAAISADFIPGGTPLIYAALYDLYSSDAVKMLLENGAEVDAVNSYKETALHLSVRNQNIPNVQLLIENYHADVNVLDLEGCSPLNIFAKDVTSMPQLAIPTLLIDHGAQLESRCKRSGRTPLHNAVASLNVPVIDYLLKRGADIEAIDCRGLSPLYTAVVDVAEQGANHAAFNNRLNVIRILLQNGANPNAGRPRNSTKSDEGDEDRSSAKRPRDRRKCLTVLLGLAIANPINAEEIAKLLVAYGAQLNASNTICPDDEAMHVARNSGHGALADTLWGLTIDRKHTIGPLERFFVNDPLSTIFDLPPFMMSIYAGDMKQVARQLLLPLTLSFSSNATNASVPDKKSPYYSTTKAADYLQVTALHAAVATKSLTVARVLLHLGANVNAQDILGATPLHYAARSGYVLMIELLLQYGAKLDFSAAGGTALVYAVTHSNSPDAVEFLLEQGADVDAQGNHYSLLHTAATRQNIRMMKTLLDFGAEIDGKTHGSGLTALGLLVESDCCYPQLPALSFLLDHGAKIDSRDVNLRTPLNAALALKKRKQVVSFLLSRGADPNAANIEGCNAPLYRVLNMVHKKLPRYFRHTISEDETERNEEIIAIVKELLTRGANPTYVDKCTLETALDVASATGQMQIYEILIDSVTARLGVVTTETKSTNSTTTIGARNVSATTVSPLSTLPTLELFTFSTTVSIGTTTTDSSAAHTSTATNRLVVANSTERT